MEYNLTLSFIFLWGGVLLSIGVLIGMVLMALMASSGRSDLEIEILQRDNEILHLIEETNLLRKANEQLVSHKTIGKTNANANH